METGEGPGATLDSLWITSMAETLLKYFTIQQLNKSSLIIIDLYIFQFIEQKAWIAKTFPRDRRFENLIAVGEDVLTAETVNYVSETNRTNSKTYVFILALFIIFPIK